MLTNFKIWTKWKWDHAGSAYFQINIKNGELFLMIVFYNPNIISIHANWHKQRWGNVCNVPKQDPPEWTQPDHSAFLRVLHNDGRSQIRNKRSCREKVQAAFRLTMRAKLLQTPINWTLLLIFECNISNKIPQRLKVVLH